VKINLTGVLKRRFSNRNIDVIKVLPIKSDEESSLVDKRFKISNLVREITVVVELHDFLKIR
jgi:hypothetical protein